MEAVLLRLERTRDFLAGLALDRLLVEAVRLLRSLLVLKLVMACQFGERECRWEPLRGGDPGAFATEATAAWRPALAVVEMR